MRHRLPRVIDYEGSSFMYCHHIIIVFLDKSIMHYIVLKKLDMKVNLSKFNFFSLLYLLDPTKKLHLTNNYRYYYY